jgi:hypothetical protein
MPHTICRRPGGRADGLGAGDADDGSARKPRHGHHHPAWVGGRSSRDVEAPLILGADVHEAAEQVVPSVLWTREAFYGIRPDFDN